MADSKHTPGPWTWDGPHHNIIVWSSPNDRVCFLTSDGPTEANARLISAAPKMLAALQAAVEISDRRLGPDGRTAECQAVYDMCEAAIAKATDGASAGER